MNLQPLRAGLLYMIVTCSPGALVTICSTRRVALSFLIFSVVRVILTACQYAPSNLSCDETVRLCEFVRWLVSLFAVRPVRRHRSAHFQSSPRVQVSFPSLTAAMSDHRSRPGARNGAAIWAAQVRRIQGAGPIPAACSSRRADFARYV